MMKYINLLLSVTTLSSINSRLLSNEQKEFCENNFDTNIQRYSKNIYNYNNDFTKNYLVKMNKGINFISNLCYELNPPKKLLWNYDKPNCNLDFAMLDNEESIVVNNIDLTITEFLQDMKLVYCSRSEIECGKIIVTLKLIRLLQSAINITLKNNNLLEFNLELIDFDGNIKLYFRILNSIEHLTNITLEKHKSNMYIENQKILISREKDRIWYDGWYRFGYNVLGHPFESLIKYIGSGIGNGLGSVVSGFSSNITENLNVILIIILIIIVIKKI